MVVYFCGNYKGLYNCKGVGRFKSFHKALKGNLAFYKFHVVQLINHKSLYILIINSLIIVCLTDTYQNIIKLVQKSTLKKYYSYIVLYFHYIHTISTKTMRKCHSYEKFVRSLLQSLQGKGIWQLKDIEFQTFFVLKIYKIREIPKKENFSSS